MTRKWRFTLFGVTTYVRFEWHLTVSTGWRRDRERIPGFKTPRYKP